MNEITGKRIRALLESIGISQKELASRISVTETCISRYISGTREIKPDVLANIATALHTTTDYLLGIDDKDEYKKSKDVHILARNINELTREEKIELMEILLGSK